MALELEDYIEHKSDTGNYVVDFVLNRRTLLTHSMHCPLRGATLAGCVLTPRMYHHSGCFKASSFETALAHSFDYSQ